VVTGQVDCAVVVKVCVIVCDATVTVVPGRVTVEVVLGRVTVDVVPEVVTVVCGNVIVAVVVVGEMMVAVGNAVRYWISHSSKRYSVGCHAIIFLSVQSTSLERTSHIFAPVLLFAS
jgi:hypothetical protein